MYKGQFVHVATRMSRFIGAQRTRDSGRVVAHSETIRRGVLGNWLVTLVLLTGRPEETAEAAWLCSDASSYACTMQVASRAWASISRVIGCAAWMQP